MLKQTDNIVRIEGILSEVSVESRSFERDGKTVDALGATLKIRVHQEVNDTPYDMEVPVYMFATRLTRSGAANPAYKTIEKIREEYISIASGGLAAADAVRITRGDIRMNEFFDANGRMAATPRVNASFVDKIPREQCIDEASFLMTAVVGGINDDFDREGNPTNQLLMKMFIIQYGGKLDVVPMKVVAPNAMSHIRTYWNEGDTVRVKGMLHFSSETTYTVEEVGFGDPIRTPKTNFVSDLIITSGSATGMEGDQACDIDEVQKALAERKARLEVAKEKAMSAEDDSKPRGARASKETSGAKSAADRFNF